MLKNKRIALFSYEPVFDEHNITSGPGQRIWEISKVLRNSGLKVTIFENEGRNYIRDGIEFVKWTDQPIRSLNYDFALIPNTHFSYNFLSAVRDVSIIIDLSTPILVETLYQSGLKKSRFFFSEDAMFPTISSLIKGDHFLCANENQYHYYQGMLNLIGKINPETRNQHFLDIAPFGISNEEPKATRKVMKGKLFPKDSKVILFPSSLFPWFNPEVALKAFIKVLKKVPNAKMVFFGSMNPKVPQMCEDKYNQIKMLSDRNNLTNKSVFFQPWTSYSDRQNYYLESDLAIVTYYSQFIETQYAYRTRVMDLIWGNVPVIVSRGETLSEKISNLGMAVSIENNEDRIAETMIDLLTSDKLSKMRNNIKKNRHLFYWKETLKPLLSYIDNFDSKNFKKENFSEKKDNLKSVEKNLNLFSFFNLTSELINYYRKNYNFILHQLRNMSTVQNNEHLALEYQTNENKELTKKYLEKSKSLTALKKEVETLKSNLERTKSLLNNSNSELSSKSNEISDLKNQISSLSTKVSSLNNERNLLKNKISDLKSQNTAQSTKISSLNNERNLLKNKIHDLKSQNTAQSTKISSLNNERNLLKNKIREYESSRFFKLRKVYLNVLGKKGAQYQENKNKKQRHTNL